MELKQRMLWPSLIKTGCVAGGCVRACACIHTPCNHAVGAMVTRQVASGMRASHLMHPQTNLSLAVLNRHKDREGGLRTLVHLNSEYTLPLVAVTAPFFIHTVLFWIAVTCCCVSFEAECVSGTCVYRLNTFSLSSVRFVHFVSPPAAAVVSLPRQTKTQPDIQVLFF